MRKIVVSQFVILLAGTLFAWGNFGWELYQWLAKKVCTTGCLPGINPFLTPCFYGAIFFTAAFVLSAILLKNKN
jgi:hypothetical protein